MALRIRKNGRIFCAKLHKEKKGDTYIDDNIHYLLSVIAKVLVTEPPKEHMKRGEWWWNNKIPKRIKIDTFYLDKN